MSLKLHLHCEALCTDPIFVFVSYVYINLRHTDVRDFLKNLFQSVHFIHAFTDIFHDLHLNLNREKMGTSVLDG